MGRLAAYPNHVELGDRQGDGEVASGSRTRSAPSPCSVSPYRCFSGSKSGEGNSASSFAIESRIQKFPSQLRNPIGKPLSGCKFPSQSPSQSSRQTHADQSFREDKPETYLPYPKPPGSGSLTTISTFTGRILSDRAGPCARCADGMPGPGRAHATIAELARGGMRVCAHRRFGA